MFLNEKLEEAIGLTGALEEDARQALAGAARLQAWVEELRERLASEGQRLQGLLERGEERLEDRAAAVAAAAQEAEEQCGALVDAAETAGLEADALASAWTAGAGGLCEAVVAGRGLVRQQAGHLDGLYTQALRACELLDVALLEQATALQSALRQSAQAVDESAQATCAALGDQFRAVRDLHDSAGGAIVQFLESADRALCAAGQSLYGLGDAVVRGHNGAVRASGSTAAEAPAEDAGVAMRFIDQAPGRTSEATQPARAALAALQGMVAAAMIAVQDAESPTVAELAARAGDSCDEIRRTAEAMPSATCASD